jgi:serine/threonine protein kinase
LFGVAKNKNKEDTKFEVGQEIGRGSYGTVHLVSLEEDGNTNTFIGKRPWKQDELKDAKDSPKERASRCFYYWQVEDHCFAKIPPHPQLPPYFGTRRTSDNTDWMIFGLVGDDKGTPAPTLSDLMKLDGDSPQDLINVGQALGCSTYSETLDTTLEALLTVLEHVHANKIVHRDVKPSNLLVHNGTLLLMDFGSAADLEPTGFPQKRRGLETGSRVAVSPIYCAPEVFIDVFDHPTAFDMFSSGLLICQLVFSFLEERMDAAFRQQLGETDWDLNSWLSNELGSSLRPSGLDHALEYLAERQGLWTLLEHMLSEDPWKRPTATQALKRWRRILEGEGPEDGPFFNMVIESMETCAIPTVSRPLHFVATFARSQSLGLVLSEMDDEEEDNPLWKEATKDGVPGEVFVKEIVEGSQAEELGIFEIGDRLQGIGELTFTAGGFERAVEMLQDQPRAASNVRLHFDRIRVRGNAAIPMIPSPDVEIHIEDLGAWSAKGKRKAQEDAFGT